MPNNHDFLLAAGQGLGPDNPARAELLTEGFTVRQFQVAGIVAVLRLLFGVAVVQIAQELIEPMHCGQVLVAVALVILAELTGGVTLGLKHGGERDVRLLPALFT